MMTARWACGCFRILNYWSDNSLPSGHMPLREEPSVELDASCLGTDVVLVKNGKRICGSGGALANAPIVQNKAYFEVKLQVSGCWGVGLATNRCDLNKLPLGRGSESWVLREDGKIYHRSEVKADIGLVVQEGDVVGLAFDHVHLSFYINGATNPAAQVMGIRGTVYPLVYVDDGATLEVQFSEFFYNPPDSSYDKILIEKSLL